MLKTADLSSQVDGSQTTFTLPEAYIEGTLKVYWNGQRQITGVTITEASDTTFRTTFTAPSATYIEVDYEARC